MANELVDTVRDSREETDEDGCEEVEREANTDLVIEFFPVSVTDTSVDPDEEAVTDTVFEKSDD